ncbi:titin-like [Atheta coriaria]|uniref:titin-like n=1 Tax=Dalotia coriaria TaxID=877792 RepID=UPI0031F3F710
MCDTPSEYKHGDIVWVKLGNCWWPGETVGFEHLEESVKEDLQSSSRAKLPFAIVKFFQEDSYEYVKKNDRIFPYNYSKKDEFIKKGLDMHRAKKGNMEKFPEDVIIAEKRTDGNENILDDAKFAVQKKEVKISEIFGSPKVKNSPKLGPGGRPKGTPTSNKKTPARFVTHPRFTGKRNDHRRSILVQQKREDIKGTSFKCTSCSFTCSRIDALALHTKTHLKADPLFNDKRKKVKKRGPRKSKIPKSKTNSIDEDLALLEKGITLSGGEISEGEVPEKKKRRKRKRAQAPIPKEELTSVKKPAPDITNDLLAEWDDGDDDDDDDKSLDFDDTNNSSVFDSSIEASPKPAKENKVSKVKTPAKQTPKASNKDKADNATTTQKGAKTPKEQENGAKAAEEKMELDFTSLLESTKVPEVPSLLKTDDLGMGVKSPEIATKLTNPKKRFVKSFEDFELSMKEKQQELERDVYEMEKQMEKDESLLKDSPPKSAKKTKIDIDVSVAKEETTIKKSSEVSDPKGDNDKKQTLEDKKHTRRSTRFDKEKEKLPAKETEPGKSVEVEKKKDVVMEEKKSTRRTSVRAEKEKPEAKLEPEKHLEEETAVKEEVEEKKSTRRSSVRVESEKEKPAEIKPEKEKLAEIKPEKESVSEDKKTTRRVSTRGGEKEKIEHVEEKVETRKSARRSDVKPIVKEEEKKSATKKEDVKTESESDEAEKTDKHTKTVEAKDADKGKKDIKPVKSAQVDEKLTKGEDENVPKLEDEKPSKKEEEKSSKKDDDKVSKKEDKPSIVEEPKLSAAKKDQEKSDKSEKSEKRAKSHEKSKPKEKVLFEIDVFGSLRAQENEKYNKKAEDSPRRETRASRSKSQSESSQDRKSESSASKTTPKRGKKDDHPDEAQVNNGKTDEPASPLISKMKNKLMNKLAEPMDAASKSPKTRQKTPVRSTSTDDIEPKPESKKSDDRKGLKRQRGHSSSNEDVEMSDKSDDDKKNDLKGQKTSESRETRRDSLRNASSDREDEKRTRSEDKKEKKAEHHTPKTEEKKPVYSKMNEEKKAVPTKAEMKSPSLPKSGSRSTGGPKTYLRSSRTEKTEVPVVKSPLTSPTKAEVKSVPPAEIVEEVSVKESSEKVAEDLETKHEEKLTGEALLDKLCQMQSPRRLSGHDSDSGTGDWLKTLSPLKKKIVPSAELPSSQESIKARDSSPVKDSLPMTDVKSPESPIKAPTSPAKTPTSPTKASTSSTKTPSSPAKAPTSPTKAPASPIKTPKSPVKAPQSPLKAPLSPAKPMSPVKTPSSPIMAPSSPIKTPLSSQTRQSPIKSPPIILNKDASKFDPASQPKKTIKRDDELAKVATIKSPKRISLLSEEVSITEKVEVTSNNNEDNESTVANTDAVETAASDDPLDLLASVSTFNKDIIEKNVTVVPENILAEGQVEIAKIIEDGTEKIATIPNVTASPEKAEVGISDELPMQKEEEPVVQPVSKEAEMKASSKPIILNSRLSSDQESTSKLLDILTDNKRVPRTPASKPQQVPLPKIATPKFEIDPKKPVVPKQMGRIFAGTHTTGNISPSTSKTKPTILSDTLIRPADSVVSVQKVKRSYDDIEDIDAFIITKHAKKSSDDEVKKTAVSTNVLTKSKPKILEHTIITAAGQVLQPISKVKKPTIIQQQTIKGGSTKTVEEKVYDLLNSPRAKEEDTFDIDNMPIVLGDQFLTSDNIETMPVVVPEAGKHTAQQVIRKPVQQQIKPIPKQTMIATGSNLKTTPTSKTYTKIVKGQRVYQSTTTTTPTILKHQPTILASGKQGKFVIVPSQSTAAPGTKYTVGKRQIVKKQPAILQTKTGQSTATSEPSGNKIMIVTNNQGQQQRVLITPEQQKLMGYQTQVKKTFVKSSPAQMKERTKIIAHSTSSPGSGLITVKKPKIEAGKVATPQKKFSLQGALPPMKGPPGQTRTVIIKNQQGEVVNRIHGTSDEDIEKQVAEQLEAINRAANKTKGGAPIKRVIKKTVATSSMPDATRTVIQQKALNSNAAVTTPVSRNVVPPLAPITQVKKTATEASQPKQIMRQQKVGVSAVGAPRVPATVASGAKLEATGKPTDKKEDRPPKQLVIQDAMGNETTIMEGQILALPSETVDGQPQSYMLVTLDESGSLTPLNNEALMSLDPNLNLGGDLSNMVLQIEGSGASTESTDTTTTTQATTTKTTAQKQPEIRKTVEAPAQTKLDSAVPVVAPQVPTLEEPQIPPVTEQALDQVEQPADAEGSTEQIHAITCSINKGDVQQNLIITGDPVATHKFLESLTEGNPEIANLLAHVEGQNILIHTDGQQILINSDVDNQMLMSLNSQLGIDPAEESSQIFSSQSSVKNQDILAAALADTDVFQQEQTIAAAKITQSQLSPGFPMAVNNVLETSTVNSPIMTPLEVPTTTAKIKESDVLNQQVPKNVDLPITITDPNIAQSVANQQVNLLPADLTASIELPLTIQDVPATSTEMSSPSFYSLPSLDDGEKFTSPISMPLLTEDPEEVQTTSASTSQKDELESVAISESSSTSETTGTDTDAKVQEGTAEYLLATGDMCTMSNQMSSLSEPPPDMFDFHVEQSTPFCNSEEIPTTGDMDAASILVSKSPKRGLTDVSATEDTSEDIKRAKLD